MERIKLPVLVVLAIATRFRRAHCFPLVAAVTVAALSGCAATVVETPLTFATANPRIEIPTLVKGRAIADVTLPEATGGSGLESLSYSLTPDVPGITFDAAARVLSGIPTEAGSYPMTYTATDARSKTASLSFTITVVDGLSFGDLTLPEVISFPQDNAIPTVTLPQAVGGTGVLTYRLTPIVPGLTFDTATRVLSGMPTTPGTYTMTYEVTDGAQETVSLGFTVAIVGFGRRSLDDVSYDQDAQIESRTFPEATGGTFTYSVTPVVPGLTFNSDAREFSGSPTRAGTYPLSYSATDALGTVASLNFVVTVRPSLRGTWTATYGWYDDDAHAGSHVDTLTFTKERYILNRAHYRDDGAFDHEWTHSGTWNRTASDTVTRTYWHNHDDDDDTPDILTTITKNYAWGDESRELLLMHHWTDDRQRTDSSYDGYRRVANPIPSPIGIWHGSDGGDEGANRFTMTVNADGTFRFEIDEPEGTATHTARWEVDEGNYFLNLTDIVHTWTPVGEPTEPAQPEGARRFAYAPTDRSPSVIAVSSLYSEEDHMFGDYWMELERQ